MLVRVNKKVATCYERASVCRGNAERQSNHQARKAFLRIEESWLNLARSLDEAERLERFQSRSRHAIGPLVFRCPDTGQEMDPGIETSYDSIACAWAKVVQVQCEHCGREHSVPVQEGYIRYGRSWLG